MILRERFRMEISNLTAFSAVRFVIEIRLPTSHQNNNHMSFPLNSSIVA
jgi:hypothetical protein